MDTRFGFTPKQWEAAKEEMRQLLAEYARQERTVSYSELVFNLHTIKLDPDSYALAHLLGEISTEEDVAGRGMLSAIVVHKEDKRPGKGFFELARRLGRDTTESDSCWIKELNHLYNYWRTQAS
jgi:hypothetical protein